MIYPKKITDRSTQGDLMNASSNPQVGVGRLCESAKSKRNRRFAEAAYNPKMGFTLIEMLTVVAIIAILIALLFPAIQGAIRNAERAKAQTTVNGLAIAFKAYYTEYGKWPNGATESSSGQTVTTNLLAGGTGGNPRGITFFEYQTKDISTNGTATLLNPWKSIYLVSFDINYDNSCAVTNGSVPAGVAVWTADGTTTNKIITSWQ